MPQPLELLAPAKNLECGMAAIDHGADAVYIGASMFGARAAAGNPMEDIQQLCEYAHRFMARVYVTVNTIVFDQELEETRRMIGQLIDGGADALLVQDMGVWSMVREVTAEKHADVEIHASTQTDNRTPERVRWLANQGAARVVLARELSIDQIASIHQEAPGVDLEAFVHGALCVSYSGVCYASQYCFGRSANRGNCAQFCRLKFTLTDASEHQIDQPRYWLSLKDMCRIGWLERMMEAGVSSFKIEGRLKDVTYVKNVVAAYRQALDQLINQHPDKYCRASLGHCTYHFHPSLHKTFNRGFTDYYASGERRDVSSVDTPKALGEYVGKVKEMRRDSFNVAGTANFANGDGLCFFDAQHQLCGFRVNRVEGNRLFPLRMPDGLHAGCGLYRNNDVAFERLLARQSAERKIPVDISLDVDNGWCLCMSVPDTDFQVCVRRDDDVQPAQRPQRENIQRQLSKLGTTVYQLHAVHISEQASECFIPSSVLTEMRREAVSLLDRAISQKPRNKGISCTDGFSQDGMFPDEVYRRYAYLYNVSNSRAHQFYSLLGHDVRGDAFEMGNRKGNQGEPPLLMQCHHCIRYTLGYCTKNGKRAPWKEPLSLCLPDGRRFLLEFDCKKCQMNVYAEQ